MSTTPASATRRDLFRGLIDDAAVFPPGNAALADAVRLHREYRAGPHSDLIGPLLLPAASIAPAAELSDPDQPLDVGVIGRPGADLDQVREAADVAQADPRLRLEVVEIGWTPNWRHVDVWPPILVLEIPRGPQQHEAIVDVAVADCSGVDPFAYEENPRVYAKFRTGETPTWHWPDEHELATVIDLAHGSGAPLKLTGGLHHAVRLGGPGRIHVVGAPDTAGVPDQHGVLNVLAAMQAARVGAEVPDLVAILAERDPAPLIAALTALSAKEVEMLRESFPSYGCCTVTDPIGELTALGLLEGPTA